MINEEIIQKILLNKDKITRLIQQQGFGAVYLTTSLFADMMTQSLVINVVKKGAPEEAQRQSQFDIKKLSAELEQLLDSPGLSISVCIKAFETYNEMVKDKFFNEYVKLDDNLSNDMLEQFYQCCKNPRKPSVTILGDHKQHAQRESMIGQISADSARIRELKQFLDDRQFTSEEVSEFIEQYYAGKITFNKNRQP